MTTVNSGRSVPGPWVLVMGTTATLTQPVVLTLTLMTTCRSVPVLGQLLRSTYRGRSGTGHH